MFTMAHVPELICRCQTVFFVFVFVFFSICSVDQNGMMACHILLIPQYTSATLQVYYCCQWCELRVEKFKASVIYLYNFVQILNKQGARIQSFSSQIFHLFDKLWKWTTGTHIHFTVFVCCFVFPCRSFCCFVLLHYLQYKYNIK